MTAKSWSRAPKDRSHLWEDEDLWPFSGLPEMTLEEATRKLVLLALKEAGGNVRAAARRLEVSPDKVYHTVGRYEVLKKRGLVCRRTGR